MSREQAYYVTSSALYHVAKSKICTESQHLSLRRSLRRLLMRLIQEHIVKRKDTIIKDVSLNWQVVLFNISINCGNIQRQRNTLFIASRSCNGVICRQDGIGYIRIVRCIRKLYTKGFSLLFFVVREPCVLIREGVEGCDFPTTSSRYWFASD